MNSTSYRRMPIDRRASRVVLVGIMALCACSPAARAAQTEARGKAPASPNESRIDALIQQLGAPQYSTREKAQLELEQLGLEAFDALNRAQASDDIEIAMRARYLVRSLQVHWTRDGDSVAAKQILSTYGSQPEDKRRLLMQQLASLGMKDALGPLCRLVKYEQSQRLSRRAALFIMQAEQPETDGARHALARRLTTETHASKRAAADWLRAYAAMLDDAKTPLTQWEPVIAHELDLLRRAEKESSRTVVRDLLWWYSDQLQHAGQTQHANEILSQSIQLLDSSPQELLTAVDWFRTKKAWTFVLAAAQRFPAPFQRSPLLLYRLADAQMELGRSQDAEQTARQAEKAIPGESREHLMAAMNLQHDGLFRWAQREYRHVTSQRQDEPLEAVTASFLLSEMLHDLEKDEEAGNVLKQLVKDVESDPDLRKSVETDMGRQIGSINSRMYFFYARHAARQGRAQDQRELLAKAITEDPTDADVLIEMFRLPNADTKWKTRTSKLVKEATAHFRAQVAKYDKMLHSGRPDQQVLARGPLATACNQLAWLVANTEGDAAEAVKMSQRSLALRPNTAGYLDTLGHCYFANEDYADAVDAQMKAAVLEPYSPQILAKLKLFKKTLAEHAGPKEENKKLKIKNKK